MDEDQENQFDVPLQDSEKVPAFGSLETSISEDVKPTTINGRLWIKLKIPKSGEFSGEESVHDHQNPTGKELSRICKVCNKGFSSGKALGGHMRIHVQANKDLLLKKTKNPKLKKHLTDLSTINAGDPMNNSNPTCLLCGKNFPSMKSLFGHMRCHPNRVWRGIQPPSSTAKNSSSSTVSDSATTTVGSIVDLSVSLSRWSVTAKRGRKRTASTAGAGINGSSSRSDEHIPAAAYSLMILARGHGNSLRVDVSEATNSNSLTNKAEIEDNNQGSECVAPSKKRIIEASPVEYRRNSPTKKLKIEERGCSDFGNSSEILLKKMERGEGKALLESEFLPEKPVIMNSVREDREDHMEESDSKDTDGSILGEKLSHIYNISRKMNKKKRRKKKWRDLETVGDVSPPVDQIPDRYKCITCNKSFPTHQALGGHRSSHNKVKNSSHTMDESTYTAAQVDETEECETEECEEGGSSRAVATPHQCKICNKTFPTGQALGGHKRCHWTGTIEAPSSQVASLGEASQTGRRILSFDLNELPAMEDEEGIESAFTRPEHAAGYASSS